MDDPDSSSLSSAPPTDDEKLAPIFLKAKGKAVKKKKKNVVSSPATTASPPKPTRPPSPPHEEVLADNPDIAVSRTPLGRVREPISRVLSRCVASTNTPFHAVHRHVSISFQRCLPSKAFALWTTRHRERCGRFSTLATSRESAVRLARPCPQPQEACGVSRLYLHTWGSDQFAQETSSHEEDFANTATVVIDADIMEERWRTPFPHKRLNGPDAGMGLTPAVVTRISTR